MPLPRTSAFALAVGANPVSGPDARPGPDARGPLELDGEPIPCLIKVVIYQAGQAAGLGLRATDPVRFARLLSNEVRVQQLRAVLRQGVDTELEHTGVTHGVMEEEIQVTIDTFLEGAAAATGEMVTRKVAEGELPAAGSDAWLEYPDNPDKLPLNALGRAARARAALEVHRVHEGQRLVERHPPEGGGGVNVRGEAITSSEAPRDVALQPLAGANTRVVGQKILAAIDGVCREDPRGAVRVVQEMEVQEVNAGTGDLPKSGTAAVNFAIHAGVRGGAGVYTSEDVLVGTAAATAALDDGTRVRARNLVVRGQVSGGQLPAAFLSGEVEGLADGEQGHIASEVEKSQIEVEGLFAAREVLARSISAGSILVQESCQRAALAVDEDVLVDGDLSGGVISFGRRLQVIGDLGNDEGTKTRIRLGAGTRAEHRRQRFEAELKSRKAARTEAREALDEHGEKSEQRGKKDPYWASLAKGEKRPPKGPFEGRTLKQFLEAAHLGKQLQSRVDDEEGGLRDLQHMITQLAEEEAVDAEQLQVAVGGTLHPGVTIELVRPVEAEDLEASVCRQAGDGEACQLKELRDELARQVADFLAPRQEAVEERKKALAQMFKDRPGRPRAPEVENRRFHVALRFAPADAEATGSTTAGGVTDDLTQEADLLVFARDPQKFYLKLICGVREAVEGVLLSLAQDEGGLSVAFVPNPQPLVPWQRDGEVRERLGAVDVLGTSAVQLLLAEA